MSKYRQFCGKTFLAIDYGTNTIGTSLYGVGREPFPLPFENIRRIDNDQAAETIARIVDAENIDHIVLGLPLRLDGSSSPMTDQVKEFGQGLCKRLGKDIFYQDETLSTKEAEDRMKNSPKYGFRIDPTKIDCVAASVIMEDFFCS